MLPQLRELKKVLSYDPGSGLFARSFKNGRAKMVGGLVHPDDNLYPTITFRGHSYNAHILAWYLYYGVPPRKGYEIDHINGRKGDNRIDNLREVTHSQNVLNIHFSHNPGGIDG